MSAIRTFFDALPAKISKMAFRERVGLLLILLFGIGGLVDFLLLAPGREAAKIRQHEVAEWANETLIATQRSFAHSNIASANKVDKSQIAQAQSTLNALKKEALAKVISGASIKNSDILDTVKLLLKETSSVALVSLSVLDPKPVIVPDIGKDSKYTIIEHSIVLKVEGPYLELLRYIQALEASLPSVKWSTLHVESDKTLRTVLTVTLSHTQLPLHVLEAP